MIIIGYDCALQNLGVCVIKYNENWEKELSEITSKLDSVYKSIGSDDSDTKNKFQISVNKILTEIDNCINTIVSVEYINVFDLVPGKKVKLSKINERTRRTKALLNIMDKMVETPDVVLIEYQMKPNDLSRCMSHQIIYHYSTYDYISDDINYAVKSQPGLNNPSKLNIHLETEIKITTKTIVDIVGPSLKNGYKLHHDGLYSNFVEKYTNYTANKKHTDWNFKYFMKSFYPDYNIKTIKNKTNDIADAFMMIFGWLKKTKKI